MNAYTMNAHNLEARARWHPAGVRGIVAAVAGIAAGCLMGCSSANYQNDSVNNPTDIEHLERSLKEFEKRMGGNPSSVPEFLRKLDELYKTKGDNVTTEDLRKIGMYVEMKYDDKNNSVRPR